MNGGDYYEFAARAMAALILSDVNNNDTWEDTARMAFKYADAMMAEGDRRLTKKEERA
jgi:hypothetical protein